MRPGRVLLLCILAVAMLAVAVYWPRNRGDDSAPPTAIYRLQPDNTLVPEDVTPGDSSPLFRPKPLDRIEPGTRIGETAPDGWTHLVFKSHPRLQSGAIDALPDFARGLAEFLFSTMTARVAPGDNGRFRLERVAIGLGTRVGSEDVIVSSQTIKQLNVDLGPLRLKSVILATAEERLNLLRVVAATDSLAIVDAPTLMRLDNRNRDTVFRYLFLVEPETGGLATVTWRIEIDGHGRYLEAASAPVLLTPNLVSTSPLHVDGNEFSAVGIPSDRAFATTKMPPGVSFPMPKDAAPLAGRLQFTHAAAAQLETAFRTALAQMQGK